MTVEREEELQALRRIGWIVARVRDEVGANVQPGITTRELDEVAKSALERHGARSAPRLAYQFPGSICISVNDALAHGVPSKRKLVEGDLVNIDVSAELEGYWADTGASFGVGNIDAKSERLLATTRDAQRDAMEVARSGVSLREVARAVETRARKGGFRVLRGLGGHGVGRFIHEDPHVANDVAGAAKTKLWAGLVIAIEPFLTFRTTAFYQDEDGWTLRTVDGSRGAQFEHSIVVTDGAPIVLTA